MICIRNFFALRQRLKSTIMVLIPKRGKQLEYKLFGQLERGTRKCHHTRNWIFIKYPCYIFFIPFCISKAESPLYGKFSYFWDLYASSIFILHITSQLLLVKNEEIFYHTGSFSHLFIDCWYVYPFSSNQITRHIRMDHFFDYMGASNYRNCNEMLFSSTF